jgi:hypothetical protein
MKEEIILKIPFKRAMHKIEKGWEGTMRFKMADSAVTVKDDEGKKIGHVNCCLGCLVELYLENNPNETMYITGPEEIWNAYCDAMNRPELKSNHQNQER